jgi:hypothetical protein
MSPVVTSIIGKSSFVGRLEINRIIEAARSRPILPSSNGEFRAGYMMPLDIVVKFENIVSSLLLIVCRISNFAVVVMDGKTADLRRLQE